MAQDKGKKRRKDKKTGVGPPPNASLNSRASHENYFLWHLAQSASAFMPKDFLPSWQTAAAQNLSPLWSSLVIAASFFILKIFVWQALHFVFGTFMCFSWLKRTAPAVLLSYLTSLSPAF